jgi:hypothetical protein
MKGDTLDSGGDEHEKRGVDLFDRTWVKVGLFGAVPLVVFALVSAGIRVSQMGVDHTVVVLGQRQLLADTPAALRVTLISDDQGYVLPTRLGAWLVRGGQRRALVCGPVEDAGDAAALNLAVPAWPPGPASLEIEIHFGERRRLVHADVDIVDRPPPDELTVPADTRIDAAPSRVRLADNTVEAFTEDRGAPTGLSSALFLRVVDRSGAPAAIPVEIVVPGAAENGVTRERADRLGLAALPFRPIDTNCPVTVVGGRPRDDGTPGADAGPDAGSPETPAEEDGVSDTPLLPPIIFNGIAASIHSPIARRDEPIRVTVSQVAQGGAVYLDLFKDGRWIWAGSAPCTASGSARVDLRPPVDGLLRLQVTASALMPGSTVAVRHLHVLGRDENPTAALRAILGRLSPSPIDGPWARAALTLPLEAGAGFDRDLAAAFALSRLYRGHAAIEPLVSSRREDDRELSDFKGTFQSGVMIVILLIGLGVVGLIGTIAFQARRRQERITAMIAADAGDGDDEAGHLTDVGAREGRGRLLLQGFVLLVIVMGAFASIALLVATMTWWN